MERIGLTVWMGMSVRNLLHGKTLASLYKVFDLQIYSYHGDSLAGTFVDDFPRLSYNTIRNYRWSLPSIRANFLHVYARWSVYALWLKSQPETQKKWLRHHKEESPSKFYMNLLGGRLLLLMRQIFPKGDFLRDIAFSVPFKLNFSGLDALLLASIDHPKDQQALYSCKKSGLPVIVLAHSWDNLTSHGLFPVKPDRLLVWNDYMVEDAIKYHSLPCEIIDVVGAPYVETYRVLSERANPQHLRKRLMIPKENRIITYACNMNYVVPDELELIEFLLEEVREARFGAASLVVRLHPTDDRSSYYIERFDQSDFPICFDQPDSGFAAQNTPDVGGFDSILDFVELMKFSDVVVNVASTIALDAILFDTPVICPIFNFNLSPDAWNSAYALHYESSHYRRVVESGAVELPESSQSLSDAIISSINRPHALKINRHRFCDAMMPDLPTAQLIRHSVKRTLANC